MIEFTYFTSGHWQAVCSECDWQLVTLSIAEAHTEGAIHRRGHL